MKRRDFDNLVFSIKEMKKIESRKSRPTRVTKISPVVIKGIREKLHQSQTDFAFMIGVSVSTLRNWEQGLRAPEGPARALLKIAEHNPKAVLQALHL